MIRRASCVLHLLLLLWMESLTSGQQWSSDVEGQRGEGRRELRVILIVTRDESRLFSMSKVSLALDYAVSTDLVSQILLPRSTISVVQNDSNCDQVTGPLAAFEHNYRSQVDVFFGPVCEYSIAQIARFSSVWNTAVVSPGAMAHDFGDNKNAEYRLLTRVGVTFDSMSEMIAETLERNSWRKVIVVYNSTEMEEVTYRFCYLAMSAVLARLKQVGITQTNVQFDRRNGPKEYERLLRDDVSTKFAVILLCAGAEPVREIMIKAAELNFINGEYVFFNIDLFSSKSKLKRPWHRENDTEERNAIAMKAYEALMTITLRRPESAQYERFSAEIKRRSQTIYGQDIYGEEEVNSFVGAFHDAVILYALAVNETLEAGGSPSNGTEITRRMWNRTFPGITGEVSIDANGDRNGDYSILDMDPRTGIFQPVAHYFGSGKRFEPVPGRVIHWPNGRTHPPPDVPVCGFDGRACPKDEPFPAYAVVTIVLGSLLVIVSISAFIIYRHYKLEAELAEVNWRIRWEDIMFGVPEGKRLERTNSRISLARRVSIVSNLSTDTIAVQLSDLANKQVFTKTGSYKSMLVAIKKIQRSFVVAKPLLMQIKQMRDLQNDHIVRLVGICIDHPNQCLVTEYCQKGSLQDVLENDHIKLDNVFKFSLIQDLVRGMSYLHNSEIRYHGNLKSPNCVVDSRFVLKLTDFGLRQLRTKNEEASAEEGNSYAFHRGRLWKAPEILRLPVHEAEGTQKADVYSFAIICQEVIHRRGPFWVRNQEHLSPQEICRLVREAKGAASVFRPTILDQAEYEGGCPDDLSSLVRRCWAEDPNDRPESQYIKNYVKRISKDAGGSLLDNLLLRMEQYAYNLESLVEERTADYLEQKKKAEDLLYMMLPRSVACQLMQGLTVKAEKYESVTIYFSDICGFTSMSAVSTPMQVVDLLNDLYTAFDSIIDQFDVYKVETIGDAYMVVSGLPVRNDLLHAREISRMALRLLREVRSFKIRHRPGDKLLLRIGIHSGGVCAGVVGHKMPRYCLFGDTVNTASRMESNGEAWMIHVSPATKDILDCFGTFILNYRGPVAMKGKGEICTWWLVGEDHPDFPDLAPEDESVRETET